jgi:hypothetical protein
LQSRLSVKVQSISEFLNRRLTSVKARRRRAETCTPVAHPSVPSTLSSTDIGFVAVERRVRISCNDSALRDFLSRNFEGFDAWDLSEEADLAYVIAGDPASSTFVLSTPRRPALNTSDLGKLLLSLEKSLTVDLQQARSDLLFLHAAALQRNGLAYLLVGESGSGKSTTAWGLLHHGFGYLSDELSPIELGSLRVFPYPHAISFKRPPPVGYELPHTGVADFGRTMRLPVAGIPPAVSGGPYPVGAVLFVRYSPDLTRPALLSVSAGEATAHLYLSTLNALSHPSNGLDAAMRIVRAVPCFHIQTTTDLRATCELIGSLRP